MGSQFCEYILQIIINLETVGFGGLHQTVHDGTDLGTTDGIHIDPVLTVDSEGADGTFCRVVVHGNITVIQKDTEMRFLIQTVLQGFVGVATGWNGLYGFFYPREISVNFRGEFPMMIVFPAFVPQIYRKARPDGLTLRSASRPERQWFLRVSECLWTLQAPHISAWRGPSSRLLGDHFSTSPGNGRPGNRRSPVSRNNP